MSTGQHPAIVLGAPLTVVLGVAIILIGGLMLIGRDRIVRWQSQQSRSDPTVEYTRVVLPAIGFVFMGLAVIAIASGQI